MDGAGPANDGTTVVDEAAGTAVAWCDRCGEPVDAGGHEACRVARVLEPPRFCAYCRRRMKVQVLPTGWRATCVEHGATAG